MSILNDYISAMALPFLISCEWPSILRRIRLSMFSFWFVRTETSFFTRSHNYLMSSNSLNWFPNLTNFLFWSLFSFLSSSISTLSSFICNRSRLVWIICGSRTSVHISLTSVTLIKLWIFSSMTSTLFTSRKRYFMASWSKIIGGLSSSTALATDFELSSLSWSETAMAEILVLEWTLWPPSRFGFFIFCDWFYRLTFICDYTLSTFWLDCYIFLI